MAKVVECKRQKVEWWFAGAEERGDGKLLFNVYQVSVWKMKSILEMGGADNYTIMWICLVSVNCIHLKIVSNIYRYIYLHNLKKNRVVITWLSKGASQVICWTRMSQRSPWQSCLGGLVYRRQLRNCNLLRVPGKSAEVWEPPNLEIFPRKENTRFLWFTVNSAPKICDVARMPVMFSSKCYNLGDSMDQEWSQWQVGIVVRTVYQSWWGHIGNSIEWQWKLTAFLSLTLLSLPTHVATVSWFSWNVTPLSLILRNT